MGNPYFKIKSACLPFVVSDFSGKLTHCILIGCLVSVLNTNEMIAAPLNTTEVEKGQDKFMVQEEILKFIKEKISKMRQVQPEKSETQFMVQEENFKDFGERRIRRQLG